MQNKFISLSSILLTSIALFGLSAQAQDVSVNETATAAVEPAPEIQVPQIMPKSNPGRSVSKSEETGAVKAQQPTITVGENGNADPMTPEAVRAENKKRLDEELQNPSISGKAIVDFPNRPSLGSLELAPIPGINDVSINGPMPMAPSVSGKDLPNEQLLGRITPEVFQEMADLERGNTFLKLQLEKERLKNDLEKLKATYRQQRLDEISKREDVVRSRIQWWQEQEKLRLEIEKKQAEEEALARKIAEQEENRDKVREEVMKHITSSSENDTEVADSDAPATKAVPSNMEELYTIDSIRGIGQDLTVRLKNKQDGSVLVVKQDDILPSGHVVREIKRDGMTVAFGNRIDHLVFRPAMK
ncbi:MAG: hypothetical protein IJV07_05040 [Alphaproteobacteria bacterium]|nr:hypothetical protein [Alphaproteobacteria bacterium]